MSDIYRDGPPEKSPRLRLGLAKHLTEVNVTRNAANVDRFVAALSDSRAEKDEGAMVELATLMKAADDMTQSDVLLMFAIMLQRLADQA